MNEAAKMRYRTGGEFECGKVTIRTPCGAVGHGGHYHSQSPEAYFAHTPGIKVVMPSAPREAKGLLLASIADPNPVVFLEPKALYRAAVEDVPTACVSPRPAAARACVQGQREGRGSRLARPLVRHRYYETEIGKAEVRREGSDITIVGWGGHMRSLEQACDLASAEGISCELINLRTILPWDADAIQASVEKTGRLIVSHEAPRTMGFAAEIISEIQERSFLSLESPAQRVCGYDMPFPLVFEKYYLPDALKNFEAIKNAVKF